MAAAAPLNENLVTSATGRAAEGVTKRLGDGVSHWSRTVAAFTLSHVPNLGREGHQPAGVLHLVSPLSPFLSVDMYVCI